MYSNATPVGGDNEADIIDACPRVADRLAHRVSADILSYSTLNPLTILLVSNLTKAPRLEVLTG
jgi:hypothetical protein